MAKHVTPAMERINRPHHTRDGREKTHSYWTDAWFRLKRNPTAVAGLVVITLMILMAVFAPVVAPYGYAEVDKGAMCVKPCAAHIFGTDSLGRDLFSRCVYGARWSLGLGIICMFLSLAGGGVLGLIAGYFGRKTDTLIMRIMDVFQAIPGTLMAITVVATLGTGTPQLLLALALSSMPMMARVVRGAILTVRKSDYIESSRAIGAGNMRLMVRHMLPNALGHIIIYAVGSVAGSIMVIAMLSYIGLGVQPPTPEWGALLNEGKKFYNLYPYMILYPGLMIMISVLALNLFGNGLRDALDPRLK